MKGKKINLSQEVQLFSDQDTTGKQNVYIDSTDPEGTWLTVSHCGDELSMKMENWEKLVALVATAKNEIEQ